MKKSAPLLLVSLLMSSFAISGCSNNSKINLIYGDYTNNTVTDIKYLDLQSKIANKETFMLAVEPTGSCACWSDFKAILNVYIPETHVIVYHMKYAMFYENETYGLNLRDGYTTFAIFESGELKQNIISDRQNMFHDEKVFREYITGTVNLPHYFYISLDKTNELFAASSTSSVIYFARSTCSDCAYVDKYVLKDYAENHSFRNDMYILDCEKIGIREYDEDGHLTPESQVKWNKFKEDMLLADTYNKDYGYNTGYVPTFIKVRNNTVESASVYFNDTVEEVDGKYKVTDSYYTEERLPKLDYLKDYSGTKVLKGLELSEDSIQKFGSFAMWKQEKAAEYHTPLLKCFLDSYL